MKQQIKIIYIFLILITQLNIRTVGNGPENPFLKSVFKNLHYMYRDPWNLITQYAYPQNPSFVSIKFSIDLKSNEDFLIRIGKKIYGSDKISYSIYPIAGLEEFNLKKQNQVTFEYYDFENYLNVDMTYLRNNCDEDEGTYIKFKPEPNSCYTISSCPEPLNLYSDKTIHKASSEIYLKLEKH